MSMYWLRLLDSLQDGVFAASAACLASALIKVTTKLLADGDWPQAIFTSACALVIIAALIWWIARS